MNDEYNNNNSHSYLMNEADYNISITATNKKKQMVTVYFNISSFNSNQDRFLDRVEAKIIFGIIMGLLCFITTVGNILVIYRYRRTSSVGNLFIISLAIADLIVGCFVMPMATIYTINDIWNMSLYVCQIWLSADYTASTSSILNLLILSLDRYWSITSPLEYLSKRTKTRALIMIGFAWGVSLLWVVPIIGWAHFFHGGERMVPADKCNTEYDKSIIFKIATAIINFYVPLITMILINTKIYLVIRKRYNNNPVLDPSANFSSVKISKKRSPTTACCVCCCLCDIFNFDSKQSQDDQSSTINDSKFELNRSIRSQKSFTKNRNETTNCLFKNTNSSSFKSNEFRQMLRRKNTHTTEAAVAADDCDLPLSNSLNKPSSSSQPTSDTAGCCITSCFNRCHNNSTKSNSNQNERSESFDSLKFMSIVENRRRKLPSFNKVGGDRNNQNNKINLNSSLKRNASNEKLAMMSSNKHNNSSRSKMVPPPDGSGSRIIKCSLNANNDENNDYESTVTKSNDDIQRISPAYELKSSGASVFFEEKSIKSSVEFTAADEMKISGNAAAVNAITLLPKSKLTAMSSCNTEASTITVYENRNQQQQQQQQQQQHRLTVAIESNRSSSLRVRDAFHHHDPSTIRSSSFRNKRSLSTQNQRLIPMNNKKLSSSIGGCGYHQHGHDVRKGFMNKQEKAFKQLAAIVIGFTLCFLPYFIMFLIVAICEDCINQDVFMTTVWLGYLNSTINPFLYALSNKKQLKSVSLRSMFKNAKRSTTTSNATTAGKTVGRQRSDSNFMLNMRLSTSNSSSNINNGNVKLKLFQQRPGGLNKQQQQQQQHSTSNCLN